MEEIKEYLKEIPHEIKNAVKAIDDETRLAILMILLREGETTFSQLLQRFKLNSSTLSHHLKNLIQASLIENYYAKKPNIQEYSFYNITNFGEEFIMKIFHTMDITPNIQSAISMALSPIYPKLHKLELAYFTDIADINWLNQVIDIDLSTILQYKIRLTPSITGMERKYSISGKDIESTSVIPIRLNDELKEDSR